MLTLKKVAVTGGIASGKSSVCQFFRELGAYVVSADALVHELLCVETSLGQQILKLFGPQILDQGKIDRRILAREVFRHPSELKALEKLLHPAVLERIEELYKQAKTAQTYTLFVVEIPLLYEIHQDEAYDAVIAVLTDEAIARERFERSGFAPEEYDRRMSHQWQPMQKAKRANYTIVNNTSLADLRREVLKLNAILKENTFP